jgi:hypothetical protein
MVQKRNNTLKKKNVLQNLIPHSKLGWALTLAPMILGAFGGLGVVAEELGAAGGGGGGGGAVGEFTMGKAPPVRPFRKEFQVALQQFQSSKQKFAHDYHLKVVRIVRKKFPGNLKAQLDYLEENGFIEFNPTTTCKQITTRQQAEQRIQQVNARISAHYERTIEYNKAHPDMVKRRKKHVHEAQLKIDKLRQQTKGGEFTKEQQATYDLLIKKRKEQVQEYKIQKLQKEKGGGGSLQKATGVAEGGLARPLSKQAEGGLARPLSKQAEGGGASLAAGGGASGEDPFGGDHSLSSLFLDLFPLSKQIEGGGASLAAGGGASGEDPFDEAMDFFGDHSFSSLFLDLFSDDL